MTEAERARTFSTLTMAFASDPVERWLYPEPQQYLASFPLLRAAFAGAAFAKKTAWQIFGFSAVAVWLPPGVQADGDAIAEALTETVDPIKHRDTLAVLELMDEAHPSFPTGISPGLV